jgi:hypothetical protein
MEEDSTEHPDIRKLYHGSRLASLSFEPTVFDVFGGGDVCLAVWAIDALKNNSQARNTPFTIGETFLHAIVSSATGRAHPFYEPQYGMSAVIEAHQEITLDEFRVILASHDGLPFVFFHTGKMPSYKTGTALDIRLAIVGMGGFLGYTSRAKMDEDGARLAELHTTENDFPYYSDMMFEVQGSLQSDAAARIYRVKNPFGPGSLELLSNTAEFSQEAGDLQFVGHSRFYLIGTFKNRVCGCGS